MCALLPAYIWAEAEWAASSPRPSILPGLSPAWKKERKGFSCPPTKPDKEGRFVAGSTELLGSPWPLHPRQKGQLGLLCDPPTCLMLHTTGNPIGGRPAHSRGSAPPCTLRGRCHSAGSPLLHGQVARCPQLTQQVLTPSLRPFLPPSMSHTQRALLVGRLQGRIWGSPSAPHEPTPSSWRTSLGGLLAAHSLSLWEGSASRCPLQPLLPVHSKVLRGSPSRTGCERLRSSVSH